MTDASKLDERIKNVHNGRLTSHDEARTETRAVCWFSCGAASAVATKLAIQEYDHVYILYQDTGAEHPDNKRFLADCEEWFGQKIQVMKSEKYQDIWDVFEKTRYLAGVQGARCTAELKRKLAERWLMDHPGITEVFGYTAEEQNRVDRFKKNNPERNIDAILVRKGLKKDDCLGMIKRAGIDIPEMYRLGYRNNNCIGCVKGQMGYWNKIRVDFPEVFERMAALERKLDVALNKEYVDGKRTRIFLDELDPNRGNYNGEPNVQCGILCEAAFQGLGDEGSQQRDGEGGESDD